MRAGQHDGVRARAIVAKAGIDFGSDPRIAYRRAGEFCFRVTGECFRPDERHFAIVGVVADQRMRIFARDRRLGAEDGDTARDGRRACRFDRRDGADERQCELLPQVGEHDGRGSVAGDDDEVGLLRFDQSPHQVENAGNEHGLGQRSVGKRGVVGDKKEIGVRPCRCDLAIDGEPAEA